jgi:NAD+ diphosphatase
MRQFVPGLGRSAEPSASSLWFVVRGSEVLVAERGERVAVPTLDELDATAAAEAHYLGALGSIDCFAVHVERVGEPPPGWTFTGLRPLNGRIEDDVFWVAGRALQVVEWDTTHRFCGRCATPTEPVAGERARRCPACGLLAYPRISPAVIVRVTRGEEILLARGRRFAEPIYSILAGFVDPGESLEETVVREVGEEAGIEIGDVRYWGSQSWPFPHSLMVGFTAEWTAGDIRIDEEELVDARWFRRDALPQLPMTFSIARSLIEEWRHATRPKASAVTGQPAYPCNEAGQP